MSLMHLDETPGKVESIEKKCPYPGNPLHVFEHLSAGQDYGLLLESAEIVSKHAERSLLLLDAALRIECNGMRVEIQALSPNGISLLPLFRRWPVIEETGDTLTMLFSGTTDDMDEISRLKSSSPFDALRTLIRDISSIRSEPLALFLGGVIAYDYLETFEELPAVEAGANRCPDYLFYLAETLMEIDHKEKSARLLGSVFSGEKVEQAYFAVSRRLDALARLAAEAEGPKTPPPPDVPPAVTVDIDDRRFMEQVDFLKRHIVSGDIYQVVPSRTFSLACPAPLRAYEQLKLSNPSPYMFYLKDARFSLFGASPESALKYTADSNRVELYPIAGTRPRGMDTHGNIDPDLDGRIELNLRNDEKEKAEHIMLVDLARNDIARVSKPNTRHVADLMRVDRYSHVMHLVSRVVGRLRDDLDALHAYQACMNMGTLTGAPKIRAAELIRQVEGARRGSYGGAVGYLTGAGDMDSCIVIRSAFVQNGMAHIQAGAGVVFDSDPRAEADETRAKARAVVNAIRKAHHGK